MYLCIHVCMYVCLFSIYGLIDVKYSNQFGNIYVERLKSAVSSFIKIFQFHTSLLTSVDTAQNLMLVFCKCCLRRPPILGGSFLRFKAQSMRENIQNIKLKNTEKKIND